MNKVDTVKEAIRKSLGSLVGQKVTPDGLATMKGYVTEMLDTLVQQKVLISYSEVEVAADADDPTAIHVRLTYRPNWIRLEFTIQDDDGDCRNIGFADGNGANPGAF